ncbi:MAG: flagellar motor switch protein FliG [Acidobacteriota bacterium]
MMGSVSNEPGLSGARKAAILLTYLGEEAAATIFRQLSEDDLQRVADEVANLGAVPPEVSVQVFEEYRRMTLGQEYTMAGGQQLTRRLLVKAFGEEDAEVIMQKLTRAKELNPREALQRSDPQKLARFIESEHPQTIALILGQLTDRQASALLMSLPAEIRAEAVKRLANLRRFSPEMAKKVSFMLTQRMKAIGEQGKRTYSGFQSVAAIMNCVDNTVAQEILEQIENQEPQLASGIRDLMFTFGDLVHVGDAQVRELTGAVERKTLATALKGTSEELKNVFFRTMSSRAVDLLKEDMEALGPVRSREVAKAQNEIVAVARQLEAEGRIVLKSEVNDEYIV